MKINLENQVILVTGGSRGIGAAIAPLLSQSGATVAIHFGKNFDAAEQVLGQCNSHCFLVQADLSQPGAARNMVAEVVKRTGRLDCLINNAGIAIPVPEHVPETTWQQSWMTTLQVNLVSAAEATEAAIPHFRQQGNGRVIHIASRAAFRGDTPDFAAYAASKGGLVAYSRSIARGYGKQGIKSFVIAPGFTRTDMAQQFIDEYGESYVTDDLALSTITEPEDIAPTVLFLASGFMDHATGCSIDINAGSYVR